MIALLSTLLVLSARADQPSYCEHPYEAICRNSGNSGLVVDELRDKVLKAADNDQRQSYLLNQLSYKMQVAQWRPDPGDKEKARDRKREAMRIYARVLNRSQDLIMAELGKMGISEQDITQRIKGIQKETADQIETVPAFRDAGSSARPIQIANTLQTAQLLTPRNYKNASDEELDKLIGVYEICGVDGLEDNAMYFPEDHTFRICPGFLSNLANSAGLDGLTLTIAHELGHSIDVEVSIGPDKSPMVSRYQRFLDCVERNNSGEFVSIEDVKKYVVEKGRPALEAYRAKLKLPKDAERILEVDRVIGNLDPFLKKTAPRLRRVDRLFPPKASAVQCHAMELCADVVGDLALERLFSRKMPKDPWRIFEAQFQPMCIGENDPLLQMAFGPVIDEGLHPSTRYRIEASIRNPTIRAALGCRPLNQPGDKPYCSLDGAVGNGPNGAAASPRSGAESKVEGQGIPAKSAK